MTYLGTILDLPFGSGLNAICLRPLARESANASGTVYMHLVVLADGSDADVVSGAVATFIPATVATISGHQPDGSTWFATFQLAEGGRDTAYVRATADSAVSRALDLTGVVDREARCRLPLGADDLRAAYAEVRDVSDWTVPDLLIGLMIELTNTPLALVVGDHNAPAAGTAEEVRRARFNELLTSWASRYEVSDAG